jgi:hypothetical protein
LLQLTDANADKQTMEATVRPRSLFVVQGELHCSVSPEEVMLLGQGIDAMIDGVRTAYINEDRPGFADTLERHVNELQALRDRLMSPDRSPLEPFKPDKRDAGLLRGVLSDITGYQRGDLSPGLRDLRQILSTA